MKKRIKEKRRRAGITMRRRRCRGIKNERREKRIVITGVILLPYLRMRGSHIGTWCKNNCLSLVYIISSNIKHIMHDTRYLLPL
jgi:hypothetical protein